MSLRAIAALFFASGISGLIYQVIWVRSFGRIFGNTVFSAALVTAVFMCGLGLGSYFFGRWIDRRKEAGLALRAYGYCELGIGLLAILIAALLEVAEPLSATLSTYTLGTDGWHRLTLGSYVSRYLAAVVTLTPITVLMGATLTLLVRYVVQDQLTMAGWRIGILYGCNTLGAALGAFFTDLFLVPELGIMSTQALAVAINLLVGVVALRATTEGADPPTDLAESNAVSPWSRQAVWVGLAIFFTGIVGMGLELVWFRHLSMVLGALRSVFSVLLTVILVGIGVGSWLGGYLNRRWKRPVALFTLSQAGLTLSALALMARFDAASFLAAMPQGSLQDGTLINLRPSVMVAGLPALFMGFSYPLANACVQDVEHAVGQRAGVLYLANTAGAVVGSLAVGFLLIPAWGAQTTLTIMAIVALFSILALLATAPRVDRKIAGSSLAAGIVALTLWSQIPPDTLRQVGVPARVKDHTLLTLSEDVYELIAVTEAPSGYRRLNTNGHAMSDTDVMNQRYMRAFSHVPLLLREAPSDALVICFGVGSTAHAASLHPSLKNLEIVDISEHVLKHNTYFEPSNQGVLRDPRVKVFVNDGRQHLWMQDEDRYDLVTMEPPPIVQAGVASLYSQEFYALVHRHLKPGGFIAQWLPAYQVPMHTIRSMVKAFVDVYPASVLLSGKGPELILLGQKSDRALLSPDFLAKQLAARPKVKADLARIHLDTMTELAGMFVADAETMRAATEDRWPVEDDRPSMEYAVRSQYFVHSQIPEDLVDISGLSRWCPDCMKQGRPHPLMPRLDEYLAIMKNYYASPAFWEYKSYDTATDRRIPRPDGVTAQVIQENSYLRSYFQFDLQPLPQSKTSTASR